MLIEASPILYTSISVTLKYEQFFCVQFLFFVMKTAKWMPESFGINNYVIIMVHVM